MPDDIEPRLIAAAEALREYEATARRRADLVARMDAVAERVAGLRAEEAAEQADVDRLEGLSLARVLASLRGCRDDALARERAEADVARYQTAEAESWLAALRGEHDAAQARLDQLAAAPQEYAAIMDEKERYLSDSPDPRGPRLLELAEERGRLDGQLREVAEAEAATQAAGRALAVVREKLASASGWSTYDTFFGGGVISSSIKHNRLDEAARAAAQADRCLIVLRQELADVQGGVPMAPRLAVDGLTRFVDVWFDNVFTDFAVRDRIKQSQENVAGCLRMVGDVRDRLARQHTLLVTRLDDLRGERQRLLDPR